MNYDDPDFAAEPGYDPWDAVDEAIDAGRDPVAAHDQARKEALDWFLAVAAQSQVVYLREYDDKRRDDPYRIAYKRSQEKRRPKRTDYMREYMRRYRKARDEAA